jgi:hypothetical protein
VIWAVVTQVNPCSDHAHHPASKQEQQTPSSSVHGASLSRADLERNAEDLRSDVIAQAGSLSLLWG